MRHLLRVHRTIPTVDMYFRQPLRDLIGEGLFARRSGRPIERLGPHTFQCGRQTVIIRYATPGELRRIASAKPQRVYYLVDDDFRRLKDAIELPVDYRRRLTHFAATRLEDIVRLSDTIVAPNAAILDTYPGKGREYLQPACLNACDDFGHFAGHPLAVDGIRMVFPGTRSHLEDLAIIAPALRRLIDATEHLSLTTYLGASAPAPLQGHDRIAHRKALSWHAYQKDMQRQRFHVALVPMQPTDFNAARSISKVFDVAAFGAAGVYARGSPPAAVVTEGVDGLIVDHDPLSWAAALEDLIADRGRLERIARMGRELALREGDPGRVRRFWLDRLIPAS